MKDFVTGLLYFVIVIPVGLLIMGFVFCGWFIFPAMLCDESPVLHWIGVVGGAAWLVMFATLLGEDIRHG